MFTSYTFRAILNITINSEYVKKGSIDSIFSSLFSTNKKDKKLYRDKNNNKNIEKDITKFDNINRNLLYFTTW